jgi:hypothetical protein
MVSKPFWKDIKHVTRAPKEKHDVHHARKCG